MNELKTGFLIAMIVIAGMGIYVLTHEATHLMIGEDPIGICVGRCYFNSDKTTSQTGYAIATAQGTFNTTNNDELTPTATGLTAMLLTIITGTIFLEKIKGVKNE